MIEKQKYTEEFFTELESDSYRSARLVVPVVADLFHPKTVVDVGCGTGSWLKVWNQNAMVDDFLGIEGPYLDKEKVLIPADKIIFRDLKEPVGVDKKFDLVMSLEVAEHLPASSAGVFVKSLISLGDVILFSAAIPGQEGTYHINEQYPEYWAALFAKYNYLPIDCIRPRIWNNAEIAFYYRQNILVFVQCESLSRFPLLQTEAQSTLSTYLTRIHPQFFDSKNEHIRRTKTFWGFLNWKWFMFKRKYLRGDGK